MTKKILGTIAGVLMAASTLSANAAFIDINLAGFQSTAVFGGAGNTERLVNIGAGSMVTGYDYLNLTFSTMGTSYLSEFTLSVNDFKSLSSPYMDLSPSLANTGGTFGPASGSFGGATGASGGAPFTDADGVLYVTTYESYDDTGIDAVVAAGTLRIFYTPVAAVPEPATYALMGLGLLGVGAAARRRRG